MILLEVHNRIIEQAIRSQIEAFVFSLFSFSFFFFALFLLFRFHCFFLLTFLFFFLSGKRPKEKPSKSFVLTSMESNTTSPPPLTSPP